LTEILKFTTKHIKKRFGGIWELLGILWQSLGVTRRYWDPLGDHFGGPGALLGAMLEVLGLSWGAL